MRQRNLCLHMHHGNAHGVIRIKRLLSGHHLIEHDADGIQIAFCIRCAASRLLRADIVNGSDRLIRTGFPVLARKLGNAEVHHLDCAVTQHHNILRLDISVDNALTVCVLERTEDLQDEMHGILPAELSLLLHVLIQRDSVDILHYDKLDPLRKSDIENLNDIRMTEHGNRLGFIAESAQELLVLGKFLLENLDGDGLMIDNIRCTVDICHSALTDPLGDFVSAVQHLADIFVIAIFFHHEPPRRFHPAKLIS